MVPIDNFVKSVHVATLYGTQSFIDLLETNLVYKL